MPFLFFFFFFFFKFLLFQTFHDFNPSKQVLKPFKVARGPLHHIFHCPENEHDTFITYLSFLLHQKATLSQLNSVFRQLYRTAKGLYSDMFPKTGWMNSMTPRYHSLLEF